MKELDQVAIDKGLFYPWVYFYKGNVLEHPCVEEAIDWCEKTLPEEDWDYRHESLTFQDYVAEGNKYTKAVIFVFRNSDDRILFRLAWPGS